MRALQVLGDDIFATFHLLHDFALDSVSRSDIWWVLPSYRRTPVGTVGVLREHLDLITANPVVFFDDWRDYEIDGKPAHFERLLFGWAMYGYSRLDRDQVVPSEATVSAFRRRAMQLYKLEDRPQSASACSVLILSKGDAAAHPFYIANVDELAAVLLSQTACSVERATWQGMSLPSQVAKIYDKRIVVSLMGADVMNCLFQPLRSAIIVPEFCISDDLCLGSREIELLFSRLPSRKIASVPARGSGIVWNDTRVTWDVTHFVELVLQMNASIDLQAPATALRAL